MIVIDGVSKFFDGHPALDKFSAQIQKGQIMALAGPDGAGKTTLIRLIAGLLKPTTGTIQVAGLDTMSEAEKLHELISYMPQKFGLYEDLTVQQNLDLYANLRGVVGKEREDAYKKLLAFTALAPFTDRLAGKLSGGMKQKLGLACSLIKKPTLLLLDEPSVGVDPISRRQLWKMVEELVDEGITVLWSTAYLDEAEKCKNVLLLNDGKLLYQGSPGELTKQVAGKTFLISPTDKPARTVLIEALDLPYVLDGVIQGQNVRVVVKDPKLLPEGKIAPTEARFEDAFMDLLGGVSFGRSALAEKREALVDTHEVKIRVQDLTKCFGSFTAVDHISLEVRAGEIFGLLGPNGAGKTTTFKMMCGLIKPTKGSAFINGVDLLQAPTEARSHIGYMAQKFSLYDTLNVRQNLEFFSGIYNLWGKEQARAIEEMIQIFSLQNHLEENADILPLGFKQRLALSCALMHRPEILFLDEPTSGVDPITRREFWSHINGLVEKGVTVMVTTHFMDEAEYCDRIGLVYRGKLIAMGTPAQLKREAITEKIPSPTLEDAFIHLIESYDEANHATV